MLFYFNVLVHKIFLTLCTNTFTMTYYIRKLGKYQLYLPTQINFLFYYSKKRIHHLKQIPFKFILHFVLNNYIYLHVLSHLS